MAPSPTFGNALLGAWPSRLNRQVTEECNHGGGSLAPSGQRHQSDKNPDIFHTLKLLHLISLYFSMLPKDHYCSEAAREQMRRRGWKDVSLLLSSGKTLLALFGYHLSACPHDLSRLKSHPQCLHGFISIRTEISQSEHKHCCIYCKFGKWSFTFYWSSKTSFWYLHQYCRKHLSEEGKARIHHSPVLRHPGSIFSQAQ